MIFMKYVLLAVSFIFLYLAFVEYKKYLKNKKLTKLWKKVYKAYKADDFATINKAVKKIKKIEDDPLIKLIEIEKYLYGKTVYQDKAKVLELLLEVEKIPMPPKTKFESSEYTKKYAEMSKKTKKKLKKEKYIKKIKGIARTIWNEHEFWKLKYDINLKGGKLKL